MTKKFKLRFEKWQEPINRQLGTIRTVPENYYVATVQLTFEDLEEMTRDIDPAYVSKWVSENISIEEVK